MVEYFTMLLASGLDRNTTAPRWCKTMICSKNGGTCVHLLYTVVYIFELQVPAHMYLYIHIDIDIDGHIRSVQNEEL